MNVTNVSNVSTDPRVLKQLLLNQWTQNVNPLSLTTSSSATGQSDGAGLFDLMLSQLMETDGTDSGSPSGLDSSTGLALSALLQPSGLWSGTSAGGSTSAFDDLIAAAGNKYGVSTSLIKGVVQSESSFDPNAVSSAGAKGLMQLMDATAQGLGVTNSFDPAQNIDGGTRFLSYLLRKYDGSAPVALAAYNAGPGRLDQLGISSEQELADKYGNLPQETQNYIRKVLTAASQWGA